MNFKITLAILLIIAAAIFCFTFLSEDSEARTCVWDGGHASSALASEATNWDTDTAPVAGDDIVFDGTSVEICTWDLATDSFGTFTIAAGYSGTITQSSDMYISGYSQAGGTFTGPGGTTIFIYCNGNVLVSGGIFTSDKTCFNFTGENCEIIGVTGSLRVLEVSGNLTVKTNFTTTGDTGCGLFVNVGGQLIINSGYKITDIAYFGGTFVNNGIISGSGTLQINLYDNSAIISSLSNINCNLILTTFVIGPTKNLSWTITDDISPLTLNILVAGTNGYTYTLNLNGHSLTATTITVGTRGILDSGNGMIICSALTSTSGTIIEDTATWVFNSGAIVTATSGQKFYNVQMKGDCDFVNSVNVTNDMRFVDVSADYDDLDIYLDTIYSVTIPSPYTFGAEITAAAEYTYLPDVQISISQFYEDVDFSIYAYISSNLPVAYNITGTASSWLSYHEGRIVGMPPDIGNYTYTITVTHETGSTDIIMGNILVGNLDTAEYGFDIILGLIWFIILTLLMFWGYHKNVPLLQVICILMLIFSAITMLRIENFDSFNLLFVLVNSVMFILGMIRYARL